MSPVLITTTVNTGENAKKIANILIEMKLAACVNIIGPIQSVYRWQDKIENEPEFKLFIKSFENKWESIKSAIKENHPYSVPEITMILIKDLQPDYHAWMHEVIN